MSTVRLTGTTSGYVELTAPAVAGNNSLTLPTGNGTADQRLVTDGSGALSFSSDVMLAAGSAGSPSLYFSGDTNTGIFSPGADQVAVATNGTERLFVDASGNVRINTSSAAANRLTVNEAVVGVSTPIRVQNASAGTNGRGVGLEFYGISNTFGRLEGFWSGTEEQVRLFSTGGTTFSTAGLERLRITSAGLVGIGTTSPTFLLELPNVATNAGGRGRSNQWATYSDGRIKTDREALPYGLDAVMQLEPLRYFHHNSSQDEEGNVEILEEGSVSIGLVAQDVQGIIPEIVSVPKDLDKDLCSLDYSKLNIVLVKALQELKAEVDALKAREAAEVVPEAVTGEKDKVDDDGNPVYQGIDQSKIVPLLTAALQEAIGKIDALESRLAALEAN